MPSSKRNALLAAVTFAIATIASTASAQIAQHQNQQNQQNQADPQVGQRLSQVQAMTQNTIEVAQLAQKKAQSPAAKNLANQVAKDYQNLLNQLNGIAKQRGIPLDQNREQTRSASGMPAMVADLNARNGADFDRRFIEVEVEGFQGFEQEMKSLRDSTPGKDAQIKGWLDQAENVTEASLNQARAAKHQVATTK
jgi:uncharacterized protein (DUF305 family)